MVFVPAAFHLQSNDEKCEYDKHTNSPDDKDYIEFLGRLVYPLAKMLPEGAQGLDFGCGPGPAVATMLAKFGVLVENYDQFYTDNKCFIGKHYDFIIATEVVEHFREPQAEYARIWHCLKPGGTLGLMTKLVIDCDRFARWHYKNDPTHISFHSMDTLNYLAALWGAELSVLAADAFLFRKPLASLG